MIIFIAPDCLEMQNSVPDNLKPICRVQKTDAGMSGFETENKKKF